MTHLTRSLFALAVLAPLACGEDYNAAVLKYCQARLGKRVGGGECAHLVIEALRQAGAEFTQIDARGKNVPDSPEPGDYVWGKLIYKKVITGRRAAKEEKAPDTKIQPGDIIQYGGARFANGLVVFQHTAVVAAVGRSGLPTTTLEQNLGTRRYVVRGSAGDFDKLRAGRVMVYRPVKATNPMPLQVTLTNNATPGPMKYTWFGREFTLDGQGKANSFRLIYGGGPRAARLTVGGKEYSLATRTGYEFYKLPGGEIGLRETK